MRMRIVVADESEARFYEVQPTSGRLDLVARIADPAARLHDRDFKSDRPGRVFDRAPVAGKRRGAVGHHATGAERRPRRHESEVFAKQVAAELEQALKQGLFDRMILIAGPPFLGLLRAALPRALQSAVAAEVPKDLVHQSDEVVRQHLPQEALTRAV
jgi:protein required for attachment to host cells